MGGRSRTPIGGPVCTAKGFPTGGGLLKQQNLTTQLAPDDAELIARAQQGEEEAFEALFHAHNRRIYRLCLRMIGNAAEAEELTQEVFMTLFRKIHTFRGESAFSTWLFRIATNLVLMRLRKKMPTEFLPLESPSGDEEFDPTRQFGSHDMVLAGTVDRVSLERAVAKLPVGSRHIFVLHDVLGCEHHEIAEILGCSIGNSKSQLHRARLRLRRLLRSGWRPRPKRAVRVPEEIYAVLT